jgi:hypothetical protein
MADNAKSGKHAKANNVKPLKTKTEMEQLQADADMIDAVYEKAAKKKKSFTPATDAEKKAAGKGTHRKKK